MTTRAAPSGGVCNGLAAVSTEVFFKKKIFARSRLRIRRIFERKKKKKNDRKQKKSRRREAPDKNEQTRLESTFGHEFETIMWLVKTMHFSEYN